MDKVGLTTDEGVLATINNETLLTLMAADAGGYDRTFILVDLAALAEDEEEDIDSEGDDTTGGDEDDTGSTVDVDEDDGEDDEEELPEYTFDWDMTRCTNDWNTLCDSDWAVDNAEIADAQCVDNEIELNCLGTEALVVQIETMPEMQLVLKTEDEFISKIFADYGLTREVGGYEEVVPVDDSDADKDKDSDDKSKETTDDTEGTEGTEETKEAGSATLMASATALAIGTMMLY